MNQQDIVERDVRLALGELQLQLIMARAQIAVLEQQIAELTAEPEVKAKKANGKVTHVTPEGPPS